MTPQNWPDASTYPEPKITMDELRALTNGARYYVKIRDDLPTVNHHAGNVIRCDFLYIDVVEQHRDNPPDGFVADPRYWIMLGHADPADIEWPELWDRTQPVTYGFHGYLIEWIRTPAEIEELGAE